MRSLRPTIAALAATTALLLTTGVAGAQQANEVTSDFECDTTTGEWVITITVENLLNESAEISGEYDFETTSDGGSPVIDFSFVPDPLPALGTSTGTITLPGDTVFVEGIVEVQYEQFLDDTDFSIEIGETCEPVETTTTTAAPTTTTTAAAATTATPRFTG
jgi:hypothetical protein